MSDGRKVLYEAQGARDASGREEIMTLGPWGWAVVLAPFAVLLAVVTHGFAVPIVGVVWLLVLKYHSSRTYRQRKARARAARARR